MDSNPRTKMREDNEEVDMDLDDALEQVHRAVVYDDETSPGARLADFDPDRQFWPKSSWRAPSGRPVALGDTARPSPADVTDDAQTNPHLSQSNRLRYRRPMRSQVRTHRREAIHEREHGRHATPHARPLPDTRALVETRTDLTVRNTLRELIFSALLSDTLPAPERAALLDDCRAQAEESQLGLPFREILSEPMDLGVPPLLYELMSCQPDWEGINDAESGSGMEVVLYLIEHWQENVNTQGIHGMLSWVIRRGCLRRFNEEESNKLFQQLRPAVFDRQNDTGDMFVDYDISITSSQRGGVASGTGVQGRNSSLDFCAFISVPNFGNRLAELQYTDAPRRIPSLRAYEDHVSYRSQRTKPVTTDPSKTRVVIEFIASRRAWRLEIDSNALKLELLDGPEDDPGLYVDARVRLVSTEYSDKNPFSDTAYPVASSSARPLIDIEPAPIELLLPRALLRTITASGPGTHAVSLAPCFAAGLIEYDYEAPRGFDDPRYLHEGTLLIELDVRLSRTPFAPPVSSYPKRPINFSPPPSPGMRNTDQASKSLASEVSPQPFADPSTSSPSICGLGKDIDVKTESDEEDDLYVSIEEPATMSPTAHDSSSELGDDWEEVDDSVETEENDGGWVKASWSGKDEDI